MLVVRSCAPGINGESECKFLRIAEGLIFNLVDNPLREYFVLKMAIQIIDHIG